VDHWNRLLPLTSILKIFCLCVLSSSIPTSDLSTTCICYHNIYRMLHCCYNPCKLLRLQADCCRVECRTSPTAGLILCQPFQVLLCASRAEHCLRCLDRDPPNEDYLESANAIQSEAASDHNFRLWSMVSQEDSRFQSIINQSIIN
jgi:hypothetical protein